MTPNPEDLLGTEGVAIETFRRVRDALMESHPDVTIGVTKSQVAFRRRRGFAFLWRPEQYLRHQAAPVVLSIAADVRIESPRFKEVVHPGSRMHHLEINDADDVDAEVLSWLRLAAGRTGIA